MFTGISWTEFFTGMLVVLAAYYGGIFLVFRKKDAKKQMNTTLAPVEVPPPAKIPKEPFFINEHPGEGRPFDTHETIQIDEDETDPDITNLDNFLTALEQTMEQQAAEKSQDDLMEKITAMAADFTDLKDSPFKEMAEDQVIRSVQSKLEITLSKEQAASIWGQ